jgi:hypothetical protein
MPNTFPVSDRNSKCSKCTEKHKSNTLLFSNRKVRIMIEIMCLLTFYTRIQQEEANSEPWAPEDVSRLLNDVPVHGGSEWDKDELLREEVALSVPIKGKKVCIRTEPLLKGYTMMNVAKRKTRTYTIYHFGYVGQRRLVVIKQRQFKKSSSARYCEMMTSRSEVIMKGKTCCKTGKSSFQPQPKYTFL